MTVWPDTIVELEPWLVFVAADEAARRHANALLSKREDRAGRERAMGDEMTGVCSEIAVALWTGRTWTAGCDHAGDVSGLEVRGRRGPIDDETLCLNLQPADEQRKPDVPFVLAVGAGRSWRVVGYTTPRRARQMVNNGAPWVHDPGSAGRPAIFVPQAVLAPLDEFRIEPIRELVAA